MTAAGFKYLKAVSEPGACGVKHTAISEKTGLSKVSVYRAVSRLSVRQGTVLQGKTGDGSMSCSVRTQNRPLSYILGLEVDGNVLLDFDTGYKNLMDTYKWK